jgi:hypothetical protein
MTKDADPHRLAPVPLPALEGDDDLEPITDEPTRSPRRSRSTAVLTLVPPLEADDDD